MNWAIFSKTLRDSAVTVLMGMAGIIAFGSLFVWAMRSFGQEVLEFIDRLPFLARIFEISLGIQTGGEVSVNVLLAIGFTHAVVLALAWGITIATMSRVIVGEFERGTADLLLTLPIRRRTIYCSLGLAGLAVVVPISFCPLVGIWLGTLLVTFTEPVVVSKYWPVTLNFLALNLAIGGTTCLVSTLVDRRAPAIGIIVGIAVVSATLNFLEPFIDAVRSVRFLSLLHYYRPPDIVRTGDFPWTSIISLLFLTAVTWGIGLFVYRHRDIPVA